MRTCTLVAMSFLFLFVGVQRFAQADEKTQMVETKEEAEANAKAETDKEIAKLKALAEGAQGNQTKDTMERAKGTTKAGGERAKGSTELPKAKPK